jgi:hypothetical protein
VLGAAAGLDAAISHANKGAKIITRVPPESLRQLGVALEKTKPTFSIQIRRREDFVYLAIDGYDLVRHGQSLERKHHGKQAVLVVGFVPQHLTERGYRLPGENPKSPGKSDASLAYPSRLAFVVPGNVHSIPLTVAGLLNWVALEPLLAPAAAFSGPLFPFILPDAVKKGPGGSTGPISIPHRKAPKLRAPKATETALELPWRLVISPVPGAAWSHSTSPITASG